MRWHVIAAALAAAGCSGSVQTSHKTDELLLARLDELVRIQKHEQVDTDTREVVNRGPAHFSFTEYVRAPTRAKPDRVLPVRSGTVDVGPEQTVRDTKAEAKTDTATTAQKKADVVDTKKDEGKTDVEVDAGSGPAKLIALGIAAVLVILGLGAVAIAKRRVAP